MLILHLILPKFVLPLSITLILLAAGLLLRRRWLVWVGLVFLWLCSTPLVSVPLVRAAEGWASRGKAADAPTVDAIVVLSGGLLEAQQKDSLSDWQLGDRYYSGLELFRAGRAPLLIFTGGWVPWAPQMPVEGDILQQAAQSTGVPASSVLSTGRVSNTDQEAHAVADTLHSRQSRPGAPRILLVTSAYHMPRAQMLFKRAGFSVQPFPVDFRVSPREGISWRYFFPSAASLAQTELAWREMYGRLFYFVFR